MDQLLQTLPDMCLAKANHLAAEWLLRFKLGSRVVSFALAVFLTAPDLLAARVLTLRDAILLALARRSENAQAQIDVDLAQLAHTGSILNWFRIDGQATYADRYSRTVTESRTVNAHARTLDARATLTVPVWTWWRNESNLARTADLVVATSAQRLSTRRQIKLAVATAYWEVRQVEFMLEARTESLARSETLFDVVKARVDAGLAPTADRLRSEVEVLTGQSEIVALQGQLTQAKSEFAAALQVSDELVLVDRPPEPALPLPPLPTLIVEARRRRPELLAAQAQARAQSSQVQMLKSGLLPQVELVAASEVHTEFAGSTPVVAWGALVVDWNVLDAFGTTISIQQAALARERLSQEENRLTYVVTAEVRSAYAGLTAAVAQRESWVRAKEASEEAFDVTRRRYEAGLAPFFELLQALTDLSRVELALIANSIDIAIGQGRLAAAIAE